MKRNYTQGSYLPQRSFTCQVCVVVVRVEAGAVGRAKMQKMQTSFPPGHVIGADSKQARVGCGFLPDIKTTSLHTRPKVEP